MDFKRLYIDEIVMYESKINILLSELLKDKNDLLASCNENIIKYSQDGSAYIFGCIENNELIGFLWAYKKNFANQLRLHISYLIIDEKYRSKGLGKKLICELEKVAKEEDINYIDLFVNKDNTKAQKFYERVSFENERILMRKKLGL